MLMHGNFSCKQIPFLLTPNKIEENGDIHANRLRELTN